MSNNRADHILKNFNTLLQRTEAANSRYLTTETECQAIALTTSSKLSKAICKDKSGKADSH